MAMLSKKQPKSDDAPKADGAADAWVLIKKSDLKAQIAELGEAEQRDVTARYDYLKKISDSPTSRRSGYFFSGMGKGLFHKERHGQKKKSMSLAKSGSPTLRTGKSQ